MLCTPPCGAKQVQGAWKKAQNIDRRIKFYIGARRKDVNFLHLYKPYRADGYIRFLQKLSVAHYSLTKTDTFLAFDTRHIGSMWRGLCVY